MKIVDRASDPDEEIAAHLAVFSSRESPDVLVSTVIAAKNAAKGVAKCIDVLVNGNPALARQIADWASRLSPADDEPRVRVWEFVLGDKAHAWNEYIERLAPEGRDCFFVDGYAAVEPLSLEILRRELANPGDALAATGVPTMGLGARRMTQAMLSEGGIHGNLFALSARTIKQMRALRFRLPLGLYRTDATIGAALSLGLDFQERRWEPSTRIRVCAEAHWRIQPLRWWHPSDLKTHWRRYRRQAQGSLENAAVRYRFHVRQEHFGALPRTSSELVAAWAQEVPAEFEALVRSRRFARDAYQRMMEPRDWRAADQPPELLADTHAAPLRNP